MSKLVTGTSIPVSWTLTPLKDLGAWSGGGTPSKAKPQYWQGGTIPWVSPKDMKTERIVDSEDHITKEAVSHSTASLINPGSVLIVTRSGILRHTLPVAVSSVAVTVNQDLKALTPRNGIMAEYVAWALRAFGRDILNTCSKQGTTVNSIETAKLFRFEIPVAPTEQQHTIVAELEKQLSRLDEAVANLKRVKANLKRYKASVLKAAVEGKLTEDWRKQHPNVEPANKLLERILAERLVKLGGKGKYKKPIGPNISDLPALPDRWDWVTMPQIGELNRGKSKHRPRNDPKLFGGPYPFIQTGDVKHSGGRIRSHSQTYNEVGLAQSRLWQAGTLCITIAANIAETGVLTYPACFPDSVVGFLFDGDRATVRFVDLFFRTEREEIARFAPATAQKNINLEILSEVAIPFPPLEEQKAIVAEVERRLSVIEELETTVEANLTRADRLRQSILAKAFSGRLNS